MSYNRNVVVQIYILSWNAQRFMQFTQQHMSTACTMQIMQTFNTVIYTNSFFIS